MPSLSVVLMICSKRFEFCNSRVDDGDGDGDGDGEASSSFLFLRIFIFHSKCELLLFLPVSLDEDFSLLIM